MKCYGTEVLSIWVSSNSISSSKAVGELCALSLTKAFDLFVSHLIMMPAVSYRMKNVVGENILAYPKKKNITEMIVHLFLCIVSCCE